MPEMYKTTNAARVPIAAVMYSGDIIHTASIGLQVGDPWVHVTAGAKLDLAKWPEDRIVVSPTPGKPPQKQAGFGKAAKDKMVGDGLLVLDTVEPPPKPARQLTHETEDIWREDGSVRTVGIYASEDDRPAKKTAARMPRKKGK